MIFSHQNFIILKKKKSIPGNKLYKFSRSKNIMYRKFFSKINSYLKNSHSILYYQKKINIKFSHSVFLLNIILKKSQGEWRSKIKTRSKNIIFSQNLKISHSKKISRQMIEICSKSTTNQNFFSKTWLNIVLKKSQDKWHIKQCISNCTHF